MRNVFFDANVVIDWLVKEAINHTSCAKAIELSLHKSRHTFLSPTTIAITSYFLYKHYKSEKKAKTMAQSIFEPFCITMENETIVRLAMASKFTDLEDAIQYFSAEDSNTDAIVTQNSHNFTHSKIAILTPEEYCEMWETASPPAPLQRRGEKGFS